MSLSIGAPASGLFPGDYLSQYRPAGAACNAERCAFMRTIDAGQAMAILHNMRGYAVVTLKCDGEIVGWLADAETLTGFSAGEAVGRNIAHIFTPSDQAAAVHLNELVSAARDGRAEDSRWHVRADGGRFWGNGLTFPLNDELLVKIFRDETMLKQAEEQRIMLLNELNHRVKNTLATVHSVAEQTLRAAGVEQHVRADLISRLHALSRAHDVLVDNNWAGADLGQIVTDAVAAYDAGAGRIRIDGPMVRLHPSQAVTLALVLHELATNAAKYGALSLPTSGCVTISWNEALDAGGSPSQPAVAGKRRPRGEGAQAKRLRLETHQAGGGRREGFGRFAFSARRRDLRPHPRPDRRRRAPSAWARRRP